MPPPPDITVGERLYRSYANLGMAERAVSDKAEKYGQKHYMIRNRLLSGYKRGTMKPKSFMRDQRIRMRLPEECVYCGDTNFLAVDHIVPTNRGGADSGDNAVWACRKCNSSKSDRDLFEWWFGCRTGFPPLFAVRIYLKQAISYCVTQHLMEQPWAGLKDSPFSFEHIPTEYPEPGVLIFAPAYARRLSTKAEATP